MKPHEEHRKSARGGLRAWVVTVSTSRSRKKERGEGFSDEGGDDAETWMERAGHVITSRDLIPDDAARLKAVVRRFLAGGDDILLLTGGTGISPTDVTIEAVRPFFEKELSGFGEILRSLSYDEIGAAAMLTRATMGVSKGKLIVCLPGSPGAVRTALRAFSGEFAHALYVARPGDHRRV